MSRPKSNSKTRYAVIRVIAMIALICLIGRLFYIQIIKHSKYEQIAVSQQTQDIAIEAKRGTITDREGNILAISATAYKVVMAPKLIDGEDLREKICDGLSSALSEDRDKIYEMTLKNVQSVDVVRRIEKDVADKVNDFISEDREYAAIITVTEDPKRYYPNGNTLSTVLGLVGADNQGLEGIEYLYDDYLTGTAGKLVATKTSIGTSMPFSYEKQVDSKDGCTIELTIDLKMQTLLESKINEARVEHNVQNRIAGVIMDVNTGEILAMTSKPDFDPNENYVINDELTLEALAAKYEVGSTEYYKAYNETFVEYKKNKCLEAYEPGSTFKIFTASMALEEDLVSLEETFFCSGHLDIGPTRVNCHKTTGHGTENLKQGLANSCNPVFMTLGMRIGQEKFYDYLTVFGLRDKTGVGLPGEQTGFHHSLSAMTTLDLAESAFGQTFKITPMQLISGVCSVINGGNYMQPYIVRSITDSDGNTVVSNKPTVVRQTVSKWEQGRSVPDADMLISLSEVLETPVATLLGETVSEAAPDDVRVLSERLEVVNLQLARAKESRRKVLHWFFVGLSVAIVLVFVGLFFWGSPYLDWDFSDPEIAVVGTLLHGWEFVFVRTAPLVLIGSLVGCVLTRRLRS